MASEGYGFLTGEIIPGQEENAKNLALEANTTIASLREGTVVGWYFHGDIRKFARDLLALHQDGATLELAGALGKEGLPSRFVRKNKDVVLQKLHWVDEGDPYELT